MPSYKNFTFPLNVYAHILHKGYDDFEYLHYGLFKQDDRDVIRAQQRASDLFFSLLPPPPCRILEVGIGLGTTLARLVKAGYDVTGISPDDNQIHYAKNLHGDWLPAFCTRLEDFSDPRTFDLILCQESAQYIDTASLFSKASTLLRDDGQLIMMDEMALYKHSDSETGLRVMDDYLVLGKKTGFTLIKQQDLSAQALPTNDYIVDAIMRYRTDLIHDLNLSTEVIDGLINASQIHLTHYREGRYGYGILHFKKTSPAPQARESGLAKPEHEAELLALFRAAFAHEMAPELWRWKYQGLDILGSTVRNKGRLVAFYGGMPRAILLKGEPITAIQIGDVMTDPDYRQSLSRKGLFFQVATQFLDTFVGNERPYAVAFGFPSKRAFKLGETLGLYEQVGEIKQVTWPALRTLPSIKVKIRPFDATNPTVIDRLWDAMAQSLSHQVVGIRNWHYLCQRYLHHPLRPYQLFTISCRLTGSAIAVLIVRRHEQSLELIDMVAPLKQISLVVSCLRRMALTMGLPKAQTWITAQHAELFAGACGEIQATDIIIPHNAWTPGIAAAELDNRWWLMAGDTDFR